MSTERRAAAKLAAPTINLASVVYGLDSYMRSRGADARAALRRAALEPRDLTDPARRCRRQRRVGLAHGRRIFRDDGALYAHHGLRHGAWSGGERRACG